MSSPASPPNAASIQLCVALTFDSHSSYGGLARHYTTWSRAWLCRPRRDGGHLANSSKRERVLRGGKPMSTAGFFLDSHRRLSVLYASGWSKVVGSGSNFIYGRSLE